MRSTYGPTITQQYVAASAVVLDGTLGVVSGAPASQGILTVPLHDLGARRLLVLGETPKRPTGCCTVTGLMGNDGVIYTSATDTGLRLLVWKPDTGQTWQLSLLEANPKVSPTIALDARYGSS